MGYTLAKAMKVQRADGVVELRQAGAPCPEADTWANPAIWIKRGFLVPDDHETALASGYTRDRLKPMRPATAADAKRGMNTPVPQPKKPLPGYQGQGNVENADGEGLPADGDTKTELMKMGREDLEAFATDRGITDPSSYANKGLLADAVLATAGE